MGARKAKPRDPQPSVTIESWLLKLRPSVVDPVSPALVSPHVRPVASVRKCTTRSGSPSPSTSSMWLPWTGAAAEGPKRTDATTTVETSRRDDPRIATGVTPAERRLIGFGTLPGLMSMAT